MSKYVFLRDFVIQASDYVVIEADTFEQACQEALDYDVDEAEIETGDLSSPHLAGAAELPPQFADDPHPQWLGEQNKLEIPEKYRQPSDW